jgi:broad specificity phosphatase PhoE
MTHRTVLAAVALLCLAVPAFAQSVVLVRHAERADTAGGGAPTMSTDPDLSEAGRARATRLADMLRMAGITTIFVTEFKRTQQTAAPLAVALGVKPTVIKAADTKALVTQVRAAKGGVLIVGHSNSVPEVAAALSGTKPISIKDDDYGNLLVVTLGATGSLLRLRY